MNHSLEARGCSRYPCFFPSYSLLTINGTGNEKTSCVSYYNDTTINNNQQGYQAASESLQTSDTSVCMMQHTFTLRVVLGVTDADRAVVFLGVLVFECRLGRLSLISSGLVPLGQCLDLPSLSAVKPWFYCWTLPWFGNEPGSAWSTPPCIPSRKERCWLLIPAVFTPRLDALDGLILSWIGAEEACDKALLPRWSVCVGGFQKRVVGLV